MHEAANNAAESSNKDHLPPSEQPEFKAQILALKKRWQYGIARKLLQTALTHSPDDLWLMQQLALCIAHDDELPRTQRFNAALECLTAIGLYESGNAATLFAGGAVFQRRWEIDGNFDDLEQALLHDFES